MCFILYWTNFFNPRKNHWANTLKMTLPNDFCVAEKILPWKNIEHRRVFSDRPIKIGDFVSFLILLSAYCDTVTVHGRSFVKISNRMKSKIKAKTKIYEKLNFKIFQKTTLACNVTTFLDIGASLLPTFSVVFIYLE